MATLLEVLKKTTDFFASKGIDNPRLSAEQILAFGLKCNRLDLYLEFSKVLKELELERLRVLVRRRGAREPLQYIIEEVPFLNLKLKVSRNVLIPRPETEELASRLLSKLDKEQAHTIIDLGTGTGSIALALAQGLPQAEVMGVDISEAAVEVAQHNARLNELEKRVRFIISDWFSNIEGAFDCIVANPPYLTEKEWLEAEPEVKEFEPKSALVGGAEGTRNLYHILETSLKFLKKGGILALETGIDQHAELKEKAKALGYSDIESIKDLAKRDRFLMAKLA